MDLFNRYIGRRKVLVSFFTVMATLMLAAYNGLGFKLLKTTIHRLLYSISHFSPLSPVSKLPPKKGDLEKVSEIFLCSGGSAYKNTTEIIRMMGGVGKFIQPKDVVILKPNAQWWNQGRTNLESMKCFIDQVLAMPNFVGEIIIAENNHFMDESLTEKDNVRGWTEFAEINGDIDGHQHNLNTLIALYREAGHNNVTKYHWRDGGKKHEVWGNGQDGGLVKSVDDGDGYVWTDDDYVCSAMWGLKKWRVKMTYPIFTSAYSNLIIDFKKGIYKQGSDGRFHLLKNRKMRLINFAVLNSHGPDTGITSALKNYMGITDLSCGWWGVEPAGYVNVHECGMPHYPYGKAGPIGYFMRKIRKADLNIVTAEWVGWGGRVDPKKAHQAKTILSSTDPIALDYFSAKHMLYPLSKNASFHDPDNPGSSVRRFLDLALLSYGKGTLDEAMMKISRKNIAS